MSVHAIPRAEAGVGAALRKTTAFLIWCVGLWATHLFVRGLGVSNVGWAAWIAACILQTALTMAQSAFWNRNYTVLGTLAVFMDGWINFGGLWPYLRNIPVTQQYRQFAAAFPVVPAEPPQWAVASMSLLVCVLVAGLPELIWRGR